MRTAAEQLATVEEGSGSTWSTPRAFPKGIMIQVYPPTGRPEYAK